MPCALGTPHIGNRLPSPIFGLYAKAYSQILACGSSSAGIWDCWTSACRWEFANAQTYPANSMGLAMNLPSCRDMNMNYSNCTHQTSSNQTQCACALLCRKFLCLWTESAGLEHSQNIFYLKCIFHYVFLDSVLNKWKLVRSPAKPRQTPSPSFSFYLPLDPASKNKRISLQMSQVWRKTVYTERERWR